MTTKQQVQTYLDKIAPGATLELDVGPCDIQAQVTAPKNHHWAEGPHCLAMPPWYSGKRSEYWDVVLAEVKDRCTGVIECVDNDCEGIAAWGVCEFWEEFEEFN